MAMLSERYVGHSAFYPPVGRQGHALGQRLQHRGCAADRVRLQRLSTGEHEHDERARQILVKHDGGNDRQPCQQVSTELAVLDVAQQAPKQRYAAEHENRDQRRVLIEELIGGLKTRHPVTHDEMNGNAGARKRGDRVFDGTPLAIRATVDEQ